MQLALNAISVTTPISEAAQTKLGLLLIRFFPDFLRGILEDIKNQKHALEVFCILFFSCFVVVIVVAQFHFKFAQAINCKFHLNPSQTCARHLSCPCWSSSSLGVASIHTCSRCGKKHKEGFRIERGLWLLAPIIIITIVQVWAGRLARLAFGPR